MPKATAKPPDALAAALGRIAQLEERADILTAVIASAYRRDGRKIPAALLTRLAAMTPAEQEIADSLAGPEPEPEPVRHLHSVRNA